MRVSRTHMLGTSLVNHERNPTAADTAILALASPRPCNRKLVWAIRPIRCHMIMVPLMASIYIQSKRFIRWLDIVPNCVVYIIKDVSQWYVDIEVVLSHRGTDSHPPYNSTL